MPHSKESIKQKIIEILTIQLGMPAGEVKPDSTRVSLGMDSLDDIEVVMAIEEEFGLEISDADAEKLMTVQDAVRYVAQKITPADGPPAGPCGHCDMGTYSELAMLNRKAREFSVLSKAEREANMPRCKNFDRLCEGAKDFSAAISQIDKEAENAK